jgi:hypothetical protein
MKSVRLHYISIEQMERCKDFPYCSFLALKGACEHRVFSDDNSGVRYRQCAVPSSRVTTRYKLPARHTSLLRQQHQTWNALTRSESYMGVGESTQKGDSCYTNGWRESVFMLSLARLYYNKHTNVSLDIVKK